jgi:predicted dienelactone hydrolase
LKSGRIWGLAILIPVFVLVSRSQIPGIGRQRFGTTRSEAEAAAAKNPPIPKPATSCGPALNLGFHIQTFSEGLRAAVWYPTTRAESAYEYPAAWLSTAVAVDAPVADCERYPLVVYSHGLSGCGTIAAFYTEALARAGYIVVAPDHRDSICKVDKPYEGPFPITPVSVFRPGAWTPETYRDRADDIHRILDEMPREAMFASHIDFQRVGATGHSLGGYTIMGVAGGWSAWRDGRIKAAVLMSPYVMPFRVQNTISEVHIPLLYQGGTADIGITPFIRRPGGAFDSSNPPKFFEEIEGANHIDWSSFLCKQWGAAPACDSDSPIARQINEYAIAFFNRYLKNRNEPILDRPNGELAEYRYRER